ncbi:MAG TPA: hypothetical protein VK866_15660 [Acidimicrobiales bacterium]|nr:hypothetical protein [Acidimicrobiales bacterium]
MSPLRKVLAMAAVAVQVSLAVSAWSDLAERPAEQINGRKRTWAMVIGISYVGPILYYWKGRRPGAVAHRDS